MNNTKSTGNGPGSLPDSTYTNTPSHQDQIPKGTKTGYVTDPILLRHKSKKVAHESPKRLIQLNTRIKNSGLLNNCVNVPVRRCNDDEVLTTHSRKHLEVVKALETREYSSGQAFCYLDDYEDTYGCRDSTRAVLSAAGGAIDLGCLIASGKLRNGFAAIRPPGHHCGREGPQGFCLVNNVAIAANNIRRRCPYIKRILIVDWDVHHGNGTEEIFLNDPDVLFYSMHRREVGFFPESGDSALVGGSVDVTHQDEIQDLVQQKTRLGVISEEADPAKLDMLIQNPPPSFNGATVVVGSEGVPILTPASANGSPIDFLQSNNFTCGNLFQPYTSLPLVTSIVPPSMLQNNSNLNSKDGQSGAPGAGNGLPNAASSAVSKPGPVHAPLSFKEAMPADDTSDAGCTSRLTSAHGLGSIRPPADDDDDQMADSDAVTGGTGLSEVGESLSSLATLSATSTSASAAASAGTGQTSGSPTSSTAAPGNTSETSAHKPGVRVDGPQSGFISAQYSSSGDSDVVGGMKTSRPDISDPQERAHAEKANLAARGRTINVPLPTRLGDFDYLNVIKATLLPVALEFQPDLIIVSAGFDPSPNDPLGNECVTAAGFYAFTRLLMSVNSKVMVCLEGGYYPSDVAHCGEACLRALLDLPYCNDITQEDIARKDQMRGSVAEPFGDMVKCLPRFNEWLDQEATIDALCTPTDNNVTIQTLLPEHYIQPSFDSSGHLVRDLTTMEIYNLLTPTESLRRSRRQLDDYAINSQIRDDINRIQGIVVSLQQQQRQIYLQKKAAHASILSYLQPIWTEVCLAAKQPLNVTVGTRPVIPTEHASQQLLGSNINKSHIISILTLPVTSSGLVVIPPQLVLNQDQIDAIKPRLNALIKVSNQHGDLLNKIQATQQQLDYTNQYETDVSTRVSSILMMLESIVDTLICQSDYWTCFQPKGISSILSFLGQVYSHIIIDPSVWYYKQQPTFHEDVNTTTYSSRRERETRRSNDTSSSSSSNSSSSSSRQKNNERRRRNNNNNNNHENSRGGGSHGGSNNSSSAPASGLAAQYDQLVQRLQKLGLPTNIQFAVSHERVIYSEIGQNTWNICPPDILPTEVTAIQSILERGYKRYGSNNSTHASTSGNLNSSSGAQGATTFNENEARQKLAQKQLPMFHYPVPNDGLNLPVDNYTLERLALLTSFDHSRGLHLESLTLEQTVPELAALINPLISATIPSHDRTIQVDEDRLPGLTDIAWGLHTRYGNNSLQSIIRHPEYKEKVYTQPSVLIDSTNLIYTMRLSKVHDILTDPYSLYLTPLAQQRVPLASAVLGSDVNTVRTKQQGDMLRRIDQSTDLIIKSSLVHQYQHCFSEQNVFRNVGVFSHPDPVADVIGLLLSQSVDQESYKELVAPNCDGILPAFKSWSHSTHTPLAITPSLLMLQSSHVYSTNTQSNLKTIQLTPATEYLANIASEIIYINPMLPVNELCLSLNVDCVNLQKLFNEKFFFLASLMKDYVKLKKTVTDIEQNKKNGIDLEKELQATAVELEELNKQFYALQQLEQAANATVQQQNEQSPPQPPSSSSLSSQDGQKSDINDNATSTSLPPLPITTASATATPIINEEAAQNLARLKEEIKVITQKSNEKCEQYETCSAKLKEINASLLQFDEYSKAGRNVYKEFEETSLRSEQFLIYLTFIYRLFFAKYQRIQEVQQAITTAQCFSSILRHELVNSTRHGLLTNLVDYENSRVAQQNAQHDSAFEVSKKINELICTNPSSNDSIAALVRTELVNIITASSHHNDEVFMLQQRRFHKQFSDTPDFYHYLTQINAPYTKQPRSKNPDEKQPLFKDIGKPLINENTYKQKTDVYNTKSYAELIGIMENTTHSDDMMRAVDSREITAKLAANQQKDLVKYKKQFDQIISKNQQIKQRQQEKEKEQEQNDEKKHHHSEPEQKHEEFEEEKLPSPPKVALNISEMFLQPLFQEFDIASRKREITTNRRIEAMRKHQEEEELKRRSPVPLPPSPPPSPDIHQSLIEHYGQLKLPEYVVDDIGLDEFLVGDVFSTFVCPQSTPYGYVTESNDKILNITTQAQRKYMYSPVVSPYRRLFTSGFRIFNFSSLHSWLSTYNRCAAYIQQEAINNSDLTPEILLNMIFPANHFDKVTEKDLHYINVKTIESCNKNINANKQKIPLLINSKLDTVQPVVSTTPNGRQFITSLPYSTIPISMYEKSEFISLLIQPLSEDSLTYVLTQCLNSEFFPHSRLDELWMLLLTCLNNKDHAQNLISQAVSTIFNKKHPLLEFNKSNTQYHPDDDSDQIRNQHDEEEDDDDNGDENNDDLYKKYKKRRQKKNFPEPPNISPLTELGPLTDAHLETLYDRTMTYWLCMPLVGHKVISLADLKSVICDDSPIPTKWIRMLKDIQEGVFHRKFINDGLEYFMSRKKEKDSLYIEEMQKLKEQEDAQIAATTNTSEVVTPELLQKYIDDAFIVEHTQKLQQQNQTQFQYPFQPQIHVDFSQSIEQQFTSFSNQHFKMIVMMTPLQFDGDNIVVPQNATTHEMFHWLLQHSDDVRRDKILSLYYNMVYSLSKDNPPPTPLPDPALGLPKSVMEQYDVFFASLEHSLHENSIMILRQTFTEHCIQQQRLEQQPQFDPQQQQLQQFDTQQQQQQQQQFDQQQQQQQQFDQQQQQQQQFDQQQQQQQQFDQQQQQQQYDPQQQLQLQQFDPQQQQFDAQQQLQQQFDPQQQLQPQQQQQLLQQFDPQQQQLQQFDQQQHLQHFDQQQQFGQQLQQFDPQQQQQQQQQQQYEQQLQQQQYEQMQLQQYAQMQYQQQQYAQMQQQQQQQQQQYEQMQQQQQYEQMQQQQQYDQQQQ